MPIPVRCNECGARSQFADRYAGETVACKACGADIDVPRARGGGSAKGGKKSKKGNSSAVPIIIGVVVAGGLAFVGLIVAVVAVVGFSQAPNPNNANVPAPGAPVAEASPITAPQQTNSNQNPAAANPAVNPMTVPTASGTTPSVPKSTVSAGTTPSGFQQNQTPTESTRLTFIKSPEWTVQPDPPQSADVFTSQKPLKIKLDPSNLRDKDVVYPYSYSDFVAVKANGKGSRDGYDVYQLSSGAKSGTVPGTGYGTAVALSPDGQFFAVSNGGGDSISVYDIKGKKSLGDLATGDGQTRFRVTVLAFPRADRMVAISQLERGVKVWELPSGKFLTHIAAGDKFTGHTEYALSPGGKFVAVQADYLQHNIEIYNLDDGKLAGSLQIEGKTSSLQIGAMGFSADGAQFAALYDVQSRGDRRDFSQFVVWNVADGKILSDFDMSPQLKDQLEPAYQLGRLQPFPSSGRWMVHGRGIVDTNQQQLIYSYPKLDRVELPYTRRVMGDDWLITVVVDKADARLEVLKLDESVLASAAKIAAAGGLAIDADLPPLSPTDYSSVSDAVASDNWTAKADPAPQFAVTKNSYSLESGTGAVRELAVSKGVDARLAVRVAYQEDFDDIKVKVAQDLNKNPRWNLRVKVVHPVAQKTVLELYAVQSGERLGRLELPFSGSLLSLSPNGNFGLVEHHRGQGRLDIFDLTGDGNHKLAWRPYRQAEDENKREVSAAAFVDDQHVGTVNSGGDFLLWNISDLKPVYRFAEARLFAVSPGGQQIAIVRGNILGDKSIALLNAQTGEGLGIIPFEGHIEGLAFHPNGKWLAVSHGNEANKLMTIFDWETGDVANRFPLPNLASHVQWVDDDYLLLNGQQLVSRAMQAVVWQYTAPEAAFPLETTTLQCLFAAQTGKSWSVRGVKLPHAGLVNQLDAAKLAEKAVVKPGDNLSLTISVGAEPELSDLKTSAEQQLREGLTKAKLNVAEGQQKIQVIVDVGIKAGETRQLSKLGERNVQESVVLKTVHFQVSYRMGDKALWRTDRVLSNLDGVLFRLMPNETAQAAVDRNLRERIARTIPGMEFPSYIFGDQAQQGLGTSALLGAN